MNDKAFAASEQGSDPLYGWWFDAVPNLLAGWAPATGADAAAAGANGAAPPVPIGQMGQALGLAQRLIKPLYEGLFQALALNQSGEAFDWLEQSLQGRMGDLTDRLSAMNQALSMQPGLAGAFGAGWANAPFAALAEAMKPLSLNLERTYGGLADAFGLGQFARVAAGAAGHGGRGGGAPPGSGRVSRARRRRTRQGQRWADDAADGHETARRVGRFRQGLRAALGKRCQ
jgi:hypothetical protein